MKTKTKTNKPEPVAYHFNDTSRTIAVALPVRKQNGKWEIPEKEQVAKKLKLITTPEKPIPAPPVVSLSDDKGKFIGVKAAIAKFRKKLLEIDSEKKLTPTYLPNKHLTLDVLRSVVVDERNSFERQYL